MNRDPVSCMWMLMLCNVPGRPYSIITPFFLCFLPPPGSESKCLLFLAFWASSCLVPGALCACAKVWMACALCLVVPDVQYPS